MWTSAARTTEAATRTASTSPAPTCAGDQSQRAIRSRDHLLTSDWLQLPRGLGAGRGRARVRGQRRVCRQQRARPLPGHLPQHPGGDIIGLVNCDCVRLHRRRTSKYLIIFLVSRVRTTAAATRCRARSWGATGTAASCATCARRAAARTAATAPRAARTAPVPRVCR